MAVITDKPEALSLNYKYLIILDKYSKLDIKQKKKKIENKKKYIHDNFRMIFLRAV